MVASADPGRDPWLSRRTAVICGTDGGAIRLHMWLAIPPTDPVLSGYPCRCLRKCVPEKPGTKH